MTFTDQSSCECAEQAIPDQLGSWTPSRTGPSLAACDKSHASSSNPGHDAKLHCICGGWVCADSASQPWPATLSVVPAAAYVRRKRAKACTWCAIQSSGAPKCARTSRAKLPRACGSISEYSAGGRARVLAGEVTAAVCCTPLAWRGLDPLQRCGGDGRVMDALCELPNRPLKVVLVGAQQQSARIQVAERKAALALAAAQGRVRSCVKH